MEKMKKLLPISCCQQCPEYKRYAIDKARCNRLKQDIIEYGTKFLKDCPLQDAKGV
jgi:hypothetical protein